MPQFKEITPDKARELIDNSDHIVYSNYKYGYQLAEANVGELVEANITDHNIRFFIGSPYNHTPVVVEPWFDDWFNSFEGPAKERIQQRIHSLIYASTYHGLCNGSGYTIYDADITIDIENNIEFYLRAIIDGYVVLGGSIYGGDSNDFVVTKA